MRILIAPCSFKEGMTASAAARIVARVASARGHRVDVAPLADGGEGTLDALRVPLGLRIRRAIVPGALGAPTSARFGVGTAGAVIEAAEVVGLSSVPLARRDPLSANTLGVGLLVRRALDLGAPHILIALGGTATVDGGAGLLHALGARFFDERGRALPPVPRSLARLARVDRSALDARLAHTRLTALVDVQVPLLGARGARMFMAQKGAAPRELLVLEQLLRRMFDASIARTPGAGAAGGLGAALISLGARVLPGGDAVLDAHEVGKRVARADLVITGEGRLDEQTLEGKAIAALSRLCRRSRTPLLALCGRVDLSTARLARAGVVGLPIVPGPCSLEEALRDGPANLARTTSAALALVESGRRAGP